ncbi:hypothetical protein NQZ68_001126 [Dissostichus eleginoides]|nr:hypothetical protein NQZ68_001126 [Dissostichus eleginoides]
MASVSTTPRLNPNSVISLTQEWKFSVCDTILMHAKERFSFTQHLISMESCSNNTAYPMLNKAKLKTELSLIYDNSEFKAVPVFHGEQPSEHFHRDCQSSQDPHHHTHDNS